MDRETMLKTIDLETRRIEDIVNCEMKKMVGKHSPTLLMNTMMNLGISHISKALAMIDQETRGDAFWGSVKAIVKNTQLEEADFHTDQLFEKLMKKW